MLLLLSLIGHVLLLVEAQNEDDIDTDLVEEEKILTGEEP